MPIARVLLLLCLLASPLAAQLRPDGPVIRVGRGGWDELVLPQAAVTPSGELLVVWTAFDDDVPDADIVGRLYRRHGVPASEAPLQIDVEGDPQYPIQLFPRLVPRAGGGFAVLWANADRSPCYGICDPPLGSLFQPMSGRFLDASGHPESDPFPVGDENSSDFPRFVLDFPSGETLFLWTSKPSVWTVSAQRYDVSGQPLSVPFPVVPGDPEGHPVGAAAAGEGGFLVLWQRQDSLVVRRYSATGEPIGSEIEVDAQTSYIRNAEIVGQRDGSFAVAWTAGGTGPEKVFLRLFGPTAPAENLRVSPPAAQFPRLASLAADGDGNVLVVWRSANSLYLQLYGRNGTKGAPVRVDAVGRWAPYDARAATNGRGDWALVWAEISETEPGYAVFAQPLLEDCAASSTRVCLAGGRFRAEVAWKDHAGGTGQGQSRKLTDDTGAFWFFGEDNLELVVKVLDGRSVNGHFWVFSSGLTDVEYDLTIRDTLTGEERVYHNPARTLASQADVRAFSAPGPSPNEETGQPAVALPAHPPTTCSAGADVLCLRGGTFRAEVEFIDPRTGATRRAQSLPLTDESGAFWFFDDENVELFIKVLDGRAINSHFWVFHGALTDIEYTLSIADEADGHRVWTYHNPRGRMRSGADTGAF